jgi:hypothetical protein
LYSLRPILLFANIDVSRHILVVDTSILAKCIMDRREYYKMILCIVGVVSYTEYMILVYDTFHCD